MQVLQRSYRGLSLVIELNFDRILFLTALGFALFAGAGLGSFQTSP